MVSDPNESTLYRHRNPERPSAEGQRPRKTLYDLTEALRAIAGLIDEAHCQVGRAEVALDGPQVEPEGGMFKGSRATSSDGGLLGSAVEAVEHLDRSIVGLNARLDALNSRIGN
jgi:hypothetical protein